MVECATRRLMEPGVADGIGALLLSTEDSDDRSRSGLLREGIDTRRNIDGDETARRSLTHALVRCIGELRSAGVLRDDDSVWRILVSISHDYDLVNVEDAAWTAARALSETDPVTRRVWVVLLDCYTMYADAAYWEPVLEACEHRGSVPEVITLY
jgi:hypothetical protein